MTQWHLKSNRKSTGGVRSTMRRSDKRLAWKGGENSNTTIAESKEKVDRRMASSLGKRDKVKLRAVQMVSVSVEGKVRQLEIVTVAENKANRQFARNNIMTKGAVVEAKDGASKVFVKVTNRPGQHGVVQGVILPNFVKEKDLKAEKAGKSEKKKKMAKKAQKKAKEEPIAENK